MLRQMAFLCKDFGAVVTRIGYHLMISLHYVFRPDHQLVIARCINFYRFCNHYAGFKYM